MIWHHISVPFSRLVETCFLFRPDVGIGTGKQQDGRTYFLKTLFFLQNDQRHIVYSLSPSLSSPPLSFSYCTTINIYVHGLHILHISCVCGQSHWSDIKAANMGPDPVTPDDLNWEYCVAQTHLVYFYTLSFRKFISTVLVGSQILCVLLLHLQHYRTSTSLPEARIFSKKRTVIVRFN